MQLCRETIVVGTPTHKKLSQHDLHLASAVDTVDMSYTYGNGSPPMISVPQGVAVFARPARRPRVQDMTLRPSSAKMELAPPPISCLPLKGQRLLNPFFESSLMLGALLSRAFLDEFCINHERPPLQLLPR
jgi:hypothetical protein